MWAIMINRLLNKIAFFNDSSNIFAHRCFFNVVRDITRPAKAKEHAVIFLLWYSPIFKYYLGNLKKDGIFSLSL